jgi:hypothetical protein
VPRQPIRDHLPVHVLALDLDAGQRSPLLFAASRVSHLDGIWCLGTQWGFLFFVSEGHAVNDDSHS